MTREVNVHEPRPEDPVPDEFDVLCENCSYSLVGLTCERCPECGHPFDHTELPLARVPWLYRKRIGKMVAYSRTWRMIVAHPREFALELCRPVRISQRDAHEFRRVTIRRVVRAAMLVAALTIGWMLWIEHSRGALPSPVQQPKPFVFMLCGYIGGSIATWVFLTLATDLPTFIWSGLARSPDDLAPMHHYACAPLAMAPYALAIGGAIAFFSNVFATSLWIPVGSVAFMLVFLLILSWWIPPAMMAGGTNCTPRRRRGLAIYLPLHWLIMAVLAALIFFLFIVPPAWYFTD